MPKKKLVDKTENEYIKLIEKLASKVLKDLTTDYVVSVIGDSVRYAVNDRLQEAGFSDFDSMRDDVEEMVMERVDTVLRAVKF